MIIPVVFVCQMGKDRCSQSPFQFFDPSGFDLVFRYGVAAGEGQIGVFVYDAEGDLSAVYPTEYSGIDTSATVDVSSERSAVSAPAKEEAVPSDSAANTPETVSDPDDSNDPGPSDCLNYMRQPFSNDIMQVD